MKTPKPLFDWVGIVLVLCFMGCQNHEPIENQTEESTSVLPDQELWHWKTDVTRSGVKRAVVQADHLVRKDSPEFSVFDGDVKVVFFNTQGDTESVLSAQRGQIDAQGNHMAVAGQVIVMAKDSTYLETDSLRWNREQDRIMGDGKVTITRPDGVETGVGFDASSDLKRWTLTQVHTRVIPTNK